MTVLIEVCVDDPAGLAAAIDGGADRIELCAALALGGLTPAPGLMALAAGSPVPVYAMIRPRAGDFVYGADERDAMRRDIDAVRAAGLAGVVLGVSRADGRIDDGALAALLGHAAGLGSTLHRAVDLAPDLGEAVTLAADLGFERVLTSGGARTALDGRAGLTRAVAAAAGRIAVMAGSGINPATAATLLAELPIREIHASCAEPVPVSRAVLDLGFAGAGIRRTSAAIVRALRAACNDVRTVA